MTKEEVGRLSEKYSDLKDFYWVKWRIRKLHDKLSSRTQATCFSTASASM